MQMGWEKSGRNRGEMQAGRMSLASGHQSCYTVAAYFARDKAAMAPATVVVVEDDIYTGSAVLGRYAIVFSHCLRVAGRYPEGIRPKDRRTVLDVQ